MHKKVVVIGFAIVLVLSVGDALNENCNEKDNLLQRCSMALPLLTSNELTFPLTREELDKSCVELRVGIKCIDNYTEVCTEKSEQIIQYRTITDLVKELCTRGKYQDEYLKHADCVKNVLSEYEVCIRNFKVNLRNYQETDRYHTDNTNVAKSHEDSLSTGCCLIQELLMCLKQKSCGPDAFFFTSPFFKLMMSEEMKECGLADKATTLDQSSTTIRSL